MWIVQQKKNFLPLEYKTTITSTKTTTKKEIDKIKTFGFRGYYDTIDYKAASA